MNSIAAIDTPFSPRAPVARLHIAILSMLLVSMPFYMFSVGFSKDWPALWVVLLMGALFAMQVSSQRFRMWTDRTFGYLFLFLLGYLISSWLLAVAAPSYSYLGRDPVGRAWSITLRLGYVALFFVITVNLLSDLSGEGLKKLLDIQILVGAAVAAFGIVQYISYNVFGSTDIIEIQPTSTSYEGYSSFIGQGAHRSFRSAAIFHEPSAFGYFLVPLLVKAYVGLTSGVVVRSRMFHAFLLLILALAAFVNFSMTAVLALTILGIVFLVRKVHDVRSALRIGTLLAVAAGAIAVLPLGGLLADRMISVFTLQDLSTLDRILRAFTGLMVFLDHPIFGVGPGGFAFLYPKLTGFELDGLASPLNMWLFFLTDVGVIGVIPLVAILVSLLRRSIHLARSSSLIRIYLWGVGSLLLLLTTVDSWYLEFLWFDLAMLLAVTGRAENTLPAVLVPA